MQYLSRSPIQQPLKVSQKVNKNNPTLNASYLRNIKKPAVNINLNISQNSKHGSINENFSRCKTPSLSKPQKTNDRKSKETKHFQSVFVTNENSMDELLDSSVNQLQKLMSLPSSNESLEEQNSRLKIRVSKMKSIIKEKLEAALKKQKQQLSKMMQDYISLITKLLQDKQELSLKIEQLGNEHKFKLKHLDEQWSKKCQAVIRDRDEQLMDTRAQIQQLVGIIENYKQQSHQDQQILSQMNERIEELQRLRAKQIEKKNEWKSEKSNHANLEVKVEEQNKKIEALIKLLEKSEMQIYSLKIQVDKYRQEKFSRVSVNEAEIIEKYQRQLEQIEQQHYEEFIEYEKAIRETLTNKDEYIQKLNGIIENLRARKNQH